MPSVSDDCGAYPAFFCFFVVLEGLLRMVFIGSD